jgi:hypothetical protein
MNYINEWLHYLGENPHALEKELRLGRGTIRKAASRGSCDLPWLSGLAAHLGLPLLRTMLTTHPLDAPAEVSEKALRFCAERRVRGIGR